jgi:hypothetical protein
LLGAQRRARLRIWLTIYNRQMTNDNRIGAKRARFCHRCVVKTSGIPVLLGPPPQQKNEFCTFEPCLHLRAQNRSRMPANFVQWCATLGRKCSNYVGASCTKMACFPHGAPLEPDTIQNFVHRNRVCVFEDRIPTVGSVSSVQISKSAPGAEPRNRPD